METKRIIARLKQEIAAELAAITSSWTFIELTERILFLETLEKEHDNA
jgi:hypothetical protein